MNYEFDAPPTQTLPPKRLPASTTTTVNHAVGQSLYYLDTDPETAAALLIQAAAWAAARADMDRTTALTGFLANYDVAAFDDTATPTNPEHGA